MLSNSEFKNVYDLGASRRVKEVTGKTVPVKMSKGEDSPEMIKHENEAMALGNPEVKKKSMYDKAMEYLGL